MSKFFNVMKGSFEQDLAFYKDSSLINKEIVFSLSVPYISGELEELVEEKERIRKVFADEIEKQKKYREKEILIELENVFSSFNLSVDIDNVEEVQNEVKNKAKLFLKSLKDKINRKKDIAREEKQSNENFLDDERKYELDKQLKKDIQKTNELQEMFNEEIQRFTKFYKEKISKLKTSVEEINELSIEPLTNIEIKIKKAENAYFDDNQNIFNSLLLAFRSIPVHYFEKMVDKSNDDIFGSIHITYNRVDGSSTESYKEYDDLRSFQSDLGVVAHQTEVSERKRRISDMAKFENKKEELNNKIFKLQDTISVNVEFVNYLKSTFELSNKIKKTMSSLKNRVTKALKKIKRDTFFENIFK